MKKLKFATFILTFLLINFAGNTYAQTPSDVLSKVKSKISGASSISADFTMTANGQTCSGKIKSKGKKFVITSGLSNVWYNGSEMWTYIPGNAETTIMKPSASELAEANPLLYIGSAGNYNVMKSKENKAGTIVLVPKKTGTGVKSVTINVDTKTYLPTKITVATSSGKPVSVTIKNVKLNAAIADSEFTYPKKKYPNAKITDLR